MGWADEILPADLYILIASCISYVFIVWIPIGISWYLVVNRPNDKRSEKEFDGKWYKWKKQYMWHELWFRTHIIALISVVVVFIFERDSFASAAWVPVVITGVVSLIAVFLRFISKKVNNRVPSDDEKKKLYMLVTGTMRSTSDAQKLLEEINAQHAVASHSDMATSTTNDGESHKHEIENKVGKEIELQNTKTDSKQAGESEKHHD
mmetsp:Transcript_2566/g.4156  ORF Transcript_2566/g.4156 Transcript_2566/m.4156 type:complete len:207 (+) Transcript_2566:109-729(+)